MSKSKKIPGFEPDEASKALIESMFIDKKNQEVVEEAPKKASKKEVKPKEIINTKPEAKPEAKRHRIRIPDVPPQTKQQQAESLKYANDELELILDAFMEFSEAVSDTIIYGHLYQDILRLSEAFEDMETVINESISVDELTDNGMASYEKMRKIRGRILNDVYNHYKKGK